MGCIVTSGLKVDQRPFAPMLSFSRPCWVPPAVPPCNQFVLRSVSYCRRRRRLLVGVWLLSALGPCGVVIVGSYIHFTCWTGSLAMHQSALSQHVALVSVKRDRAKEGLRINEGELRDKSG